LVAKYPKVKLMEQEISASRAWRDLDTVQGASAEKIVNDWTRVLVTKYPKMKLIWKRRAFEIGYVERCVVRQNDVKR
jgi:hypothetical protein